jgi:hypothetical protein
MKQHANIQTALSAFVAAGHGIAMCLPAALWQFEVQRFFKTATCSSQALVRK